MKHRIICGKSEEELKQFDDNSFDSCITDPPYGLEFMGKDWDKLGGGIEETAISAGGFSRKGKGKGDNPYANTRIRYGKSAKSAQEWHYNWAKEIFRVLKPGAHILVFGGTRTYHRMACAIEDAGFEIRDMIEWFYGSGFPKSLNISKAMDKLKGVERKVIGKDKSGKRESHIAGLTGNLDPSEDNSFGGEYEITEPTSPEAVTWNGWGTALKPAHEPILLARKPLSEKNIADNILKWGTGGINIDDCRVGLTGGTRSKGKGIESEICYGNGLNKTGVESIDMGRFPTNLILECCCDEIENTTNHNPILLARKPIDERTIAENILKWGTGGLNIDESRIDHDEDLSIKRDGNIKLDSNEQGWGFKAVSRGNEGRFPTNLILECCCDEDEIVEDITNHSPILLARKPISEKNIAENILRLGTGGLNIDECRIKHNETIKETKRDSRGASWNDDNCGLRNEQNILASASPLGRFPTNLILSCCCKDDELVEGIAKGNQGHWSKTKTTGFGTFGGGKSEYDGVGKKDSMHCLIHTNPDCVCKMLDDQSGELKSGKMNSTAKGGQFGVYGKQYPRKVTSPKSSGGASRFFYQAKASQNERWLYCTICKEAFQTKEKDNHIHGAPKKEKYKYLEFHPTQKPVDLMIYLERLITPPNGTILEPFMGTGTSLIAAEREGFNSVGIDNKPEYCLMSYRRLEDEISQQTKLIGELSTIERIGF